MTVSSVLTLAALILSTVTIGGLPGQSPDQGTSQAPKAAKIGEVVPDFEFPMVWNGDGRRKLSEFRGQPVMIEFWGTN
jgi:hypothetical protein